MKYRTVLALVVMTAVSAQAGNWPQWRGPYFNGSTDEENLPSDWSTTENVAWSVELPGCSAATPIVWEDRVFLSGVDSADDKLQAMCFDRTNGELLWRHDVAEGVRRDRRSTFAAPSAVTDGKIVVFFYGSGPLACFDLDGKLRWKRNIADDYGPFAFLWTFSSSPTLWGGKLYMQVLQRDVPVDGRGLEGQQNRSYLLAMDSQTGRSLWRHFRPSEAVAESREAFTTPIPFSHDGHQQLLIAGGDAITGHDPETGQELWRWGDWNPGRITHWRHVPSPVAGGGVILLCAPKGEPIYAIEAGGSGLLDDRAVAWTSRDVREVSADVPTPAYYDGDFFVLSHVRKHVSRVEPGSGRVKWTVPTPSRAKYEASPLAADGKIYIMNFDGEVAVMSADTGKLLNVIPMDEPAGGEVVRASISAAHGQLFIRTTRRLYCVGQSR